MARIVERAEVFLFRFQLEKPFRIALGATTEKTEVIVALHDDEGHVGWGEASPSALILGSTADTVLAALDVLIPAVLGEDPRRRAHIVHKLDRILLGQRTAKAALDLALHDLVGQIYGEPVWRLLGGAHPGPVDTDFTVTIDSPPAMAAEARELVAAGFGTIKVKVGQDPRLDVDRVRAVRAAVGAGTRLRIDANQGWTRAEAVWALARMEECDVEFVEQPVRADDVEGLAWVRRRSPIPVMADEAVHTAHDAGRVIAAGAADYVNIKLMKAGGLGEALRIASLCEVAGVPCMIGGMVESNLSASAAVHFALAHGNVAFRDLDLAAHPGADLVAAGASELRGGFQALPDPEAPGFGFREVRRDRLELVRTYRVGDRAGTADV